MCNLEGLWPYVWQHHHKEALACDGVVIISHVGVQKLIQDQFWPVVRLYDFLDRKGWRISGHNGPV
jgi:hypothetical protein